MVFVAIGEVVGGLIFGRLMDALGSQKTLGELAFAACADDGRGANPMITHPLI